MAMHRWEANSDCVVGSPWLRQRVVSTLQSFIMTAGAGIMLADTWSLARRRDERPTQQ